MKTNKRLGISLIVLVITIIVMIILATAIILSLESSGIIGKANEAKTDMNSASLLEAANTAYAEYYLKIKTGETITGTAEDYVKNNLRTQGYTDDQLAKLNVTDNGEITLDEDSNNDGDSGVIPVPENYVKSYNLNSDVGQIVGYLVTNSENSSAYDLVFIGTGAFDAEARYTWELTDIGSFASLTQYTKDIINITFSEGITNIPHWTFTNSSTIKSITIPKSVTNIGDAAFYNDSALDTIIYNGTVAEWNNITIEENGASFGDGSPLLTQITCSDGVVQL